MANNRLIPRKMKIWMRGAAAGGTGAWDDISGFGLEVTRMTKRTPIDTGGASDFGKRTDKGDPDDSLKISLFHSETYGDLTGKLMTELKADGDTEFMWVLRGADAVSSGNPATRCKLKLTDVPGVGGAKNTVAKFDVTLPIEGVFQISTTAGSPPADNTFADDI